MKIPCPACESETPDGLLCKTCTRRLRKDLADLPGLMDELVVTRTRQSQAGTGNGGRGADSALPYDWNASHVREDVGNTLSTWIRELDLGDTGGLAGDIRAWCRWLSDRTERIRGHAEAAQLLDEITYQVGDVRRAIDTGADMVFCGTCQVCGRDMFAPATADEAACRYCSWAGITSTLPVRGARSQLWAHAENKLIPRRLLLDAMPVYGLEVNPSTFRTWIHRGHLQPREHRNGAPLYRLGDALDLARNMPNRDGLDESA